MNRVASLILAGCLPPWGSIMCKHFIFKSYTLRVHVYSESCKPVSSSLKPQVPPPHWRNLSMVLKSNCATGRLTRHCSHTMCRWEQTICRYRWKQSSHQNIMLMSYFPLDKGVLISTYLLLWLLLDRMALLCMPHKIHLYTFSDILI